MEPAEAEAFHLRMADHHDCQLSMADAIGDYPEACKYHEAQMRFHRACAKEIAADWPEEAETGRKAYDAECDAIAEAA